MKSRTRIGVKAITTLTTTNGNSGTRRRLNRYDGPSLRIRRLMASSRWPKRACSAPRSTWRATRKAQVAPSVLAKDTSSVPHVNPNSAPAARVMTAAPGIDSAVTST
jgi:hypothetical protein